MVFRHFLLALMLLATVMGVGSLKSSAQIIPMAFWQSGTLTFGGSGNAVRFTQSPGLTYFYQTRTNATPDTNSRIKTYSVWLKRSAVTTGNFQHIISNSIGPNDRWQVNFTGSDQIQVIAIESGVTVLNKISTATFRDISSWYHLVVATDTTNATVAEDRVKVYVNGVRLTSFGTNTNPAVNNMYAGLFTSPLGGTWYPRIGTEYANEAASVFTNRYQGYMADFYMIDGQQLEPSIFGEYNANGIWVPKTPTSPVYGNTGFYLPFSDATSLATLGNSVPNANDWTGSGFTLTGTNADIVTDSPEMRDPGISNYATINPLSFSGNATQTALNSQAVGSYPVTQGNLRADINNTGAANWVNRATTICPSSGKWYFEIENLGSPAGAGEWWNMSLFDHDYPGLPTRPASVAGSARFTVRDDTVYAGGDFKGTNTIMAIAFDLDAGRAWVGRALSGAGSMTWHNSGNPAGNTTPTFTWTPDGHATCPSLGGYQMGASPLLFRAGAQGFKYPAPSGFLALNANNLPAPAITKPSQYFKTVTYTGNGTFQSVGEPAKQTSGVSLPNSLRFRRASSTYLSRTPPSDGTRTTWTYSAWVKRSSLGVEQSIFDASANVNAQHRLQFNSDDTIWFDYYTGAFSARLTTNQVFRDTSAWHHIVAVWDTTNSTTTDRLRLYVDGVRVTSFSNAVYPGSTSAPIASTSAHSIGRRTYSADNYFDGYLADVYFTDGQALTASSFGEYDADGDWVPKAYTGPYGTTGFHLDFADTSGTTATTLGKDAAGSNNWTPNNFNVASSNPFLFNPSGFRVGSNPLINTNTNGYISWNWKEGVTPGLDIVTYTGTGANINVGHNLGVPATFAITKNIASGSTDWFVYHTSVGAGKYLLLNTTAPSVTHADTYTGSVPTHLGHTGASLVNTAGQTYISYIFTDVPGFSKFGSYTGNGSADGPFVHTGFKPAFVMVKSTNGTGSWTIMDSARSPSNPVARTLFPDDPAADNTTARGDLLSNGFKIRDTNTLMNANTQTFIYAAFAESPFKEQSAAANLDVLNGLRFNGTNTYLSRTPSSAGDRRIWTWSAWVKPTSNGKLLSARIGGDNNNRDAIFFDANNKLVIVNLTGGILTTHLESTAVFRDPAAWGHLVIAADTTQGTNTNRLRAWWNGVPITSWSTAIYPGASEQFAINATTSHVIGYENQVSPAGYFHGYLADVHFVDGSALTPPSFGEANAAGLWVPKAYSGTYGTNGFHLDFSDSANVGKDAAGSNDWTANNFITENNNPFVFKPTGFQVGSNALINTNTNNYISWNWKKGATPGFDVVTWSGNGANRTLSHGLGVAPKMMIVKSIGSGASNVAWYVYHSGISATPHTARIQLNETSAITTGSSVWNSTAPTNTQFTVSSELSTSGVPYIAYVFAEVSGFSKFGSYTGNGSADGPFVHTGFKPAYVMVKRTDSTGWWYPFDTARSPTNPANKIIELNGALAETSGTYQIDILSNGFKLRGTHVDNNASGGTYIYAAFAESPFKEQYTAANLDVLNGLRFNSANSAYLNRTPAAGSDKTRFTISTWVKRNNVSGAAGYDFAAAGQTGAPFNQFAARLTADGSFLVFNWPNAYNICKQSAATFRDPSTWYHMVVSYDSNLGTASERLKMYVNGQRITAFQTTLCGNIDPGAAAVTSWNNDAQTSSIGRFGIPTYGYADFQLSDYYNIDGAALTPAAFGETNAAGLWVPKAYSGTYGTNGFHLDFSDSANVGKDAAGSNDWTANNFITENNNPFVFKPTGFQVGSNALINTNTNNYIGWNWKKGATAKFDVVTYTGNGATSQSIPHNLGVVPAFIIVKPYAGVADSWRVWHQSVSPAGANNLHLLLDTSGGYNGAAGNLVFYGQPTSSVFTLGNNQATNGNGMQYVAYLWADVPGFSKFGSYTGNGSADGPFIHMGFKPAYILVKRADTTGDWVVWDTARDTYNPAGRDLYPYALNAEANNPPRLDFLSNGVKWRTTHAAINASGGTYIYAAFAESPFKEQSTAASLSVANSARFNGTTASLSRTPGSPGNRQVWTWSGWIKRSNLNTGAAQYLFSGGNTGGAYTGILLSADGGAVGDSLRVFDWTGAAYNGHKITTALLRDPAKWYHVVVSWDTGAAAADRIKIYLDGVRLTSFSSSADPGTGNTAINSADLHRIGWRSQGSTTEYFNGYMADVNFVDGTALTPTSFGEANSAGAWVPKAYAGGYGTNGFRLEFANPAAPGTASGTSNDWTPSGLVSTDVYADSPTNNYATLNAFANGGHVLSQGNLQMTGPTAYRTTLSNFGMLTGKWYAEATVTVSGTSGGMGMGLAREQINLSDYIEATSNGWTYNQSNGNKGTNAGYAAYGAGYATGDVVGVAFDADAGKLYFSKNGVWQASGDPVAGTNFAYSGLTTGPYFFAGTTYYSTSNFLWNFGQGGVSGTSYDAASGGTFKYTPPAGFKAVSTSNMAASAIPNPGLHFKPVTYTGTNANQTIAVGFQPDLTWIKDRTSGTNGHVLEDSARVNAGSPYLSTNTNAAQIKLFNPATIDILRDTPTNNFATLNPLMQHTSSVHTLTGGNLNYINTNGVTAYSAVGTQAMTRKVYFEAYINGAPTSIYPVIGSMRAGVPVTNMGSLCGASAPVGGFAYEANSGKVNVQGVTQATYATTPNTGIVRFAYDPATGKVWIGKEGGWFNAGDPAAGTGQVGTVTLDPRDQLPCVVSYNNAHVSLNFGQQTFAYAPPAGFDTLSTTPMAASAITNPSQFFKAVTYTGTNANQTVTVGFQPDLTWIKDRTSGTNGHVLEDSARVGATSPYLQTNTTAGQIAFFNASLRDNLFDTPTNNYPTFSLLNRLNGTPATLSLAGMTTTPTASAMNASGVAYPRTGKWYSEIEFASGGFPVFGIANQNHAGGGVDTNIWGHYANGGNGIIFRNGSNTAADANAPNTAGDYMLVAVDVPNNKIWLGRNRGGVSSWMGGGDPATNTAPTFSGGGGGGVYSTSVNLAVNDWYLVAAGGGTWTGNINFGQRPFAGPVPAGFLALNTTNMAASAIATPSDYFKAVTYTGTNAGQNVSVGFSPDLTWIKDRTSGTNGHVLEDSVRVGTNSPYLQTNTAAAQIDFFSAALRDDLTDVPTAYDASHGNFATLTPYRIATSGIALSGGNLTATISLNNKSVGGSIAVNTGKWYFEVTPLGSSPSLGVAVATSLAADYTMYYPQPGVSYNASGGMWGGTPASGLPTYTAGDVIGVAMDADAGTISWYKNGVFVVTNNVTPNTWLVPAVGESVSSNLPIHVNFGQRPFSYTPPTGFNRLQSYNFANASFTPDLAIIKSRGAATGWALYDRVRGPSLELDTSTNAAQTVQATGLLSFQNGGFTLGSLAKANTSAVNYVSYLFKKGVTPGFDIITYEGNSTDGRQISHSLGAAPSLIITKNSRTASGFNDWNVWHKSYVAATDQLWMHSNAGRNVNGWASGNPNASYFVPARTSYDNVTNYGYVAYLFADVPGFSKFGSYTGNGSTEGPFIYTGFKPAFVLYKRLDTTGDWGLLDNLRNSSNPTDLAFFMNSSGAESGASTYMVDFVANGFKIRNATANWNASGGTYIYAAFAENPLKGSPAR